MNCPRCRAPDFRLTCRQCGLLTPRAIEEVRKALAAVRQRRHGGMVHDLLRQALERQGVLTDDDIRTVVQHASPNSQDASRPSAPASARSVKANETQPPLTRQSRPRGACDVCGGRNFAWASKCDHCGRPLSSPKEPERSGTATHRQPVTSPDQPTVALTPPTISWSPDDLGRTARGIPWRVGELLFGWYRIESIRSGGFGVAYLCRHTATQEGQAIKTVLREPLSEGRVRHDMRQEAEVWALLEPHPNVVTCHFVQTSPVDKRLWLGLERVDGHPTRGTTLREWMKRGLLETDAVVRIALGMCAGMGHVATAGFVHRDLKPENVLLTAQGFAKVTDLGLARPIVQDVDGSTVPIAGTPGYMSPESWLGSTSTAGDVYAFGVILWELLAGSHPFAATEMPLQLAHRDVTPADPRTVNPDASASLSLIAQQCLAKGPDERPGFAEVLTRMRQEWPAISSHDNEVQVGIGTMCNRVLALTTLGRFAEAERVIEQAFRRVSDHPLVHAVRIGLFKTLGRLDEARDSLETVARVESTSPDVLMFKSDALWHLGRRDDALAALDEALTIEPGNGGCLYEKGKTLVRLGRDDQARAVLEQCAGEATESGVMALIALAELERSRGHASEALGYLTRALAANPNGEETLCRLGRVLAETGDTHRALDCARRAVAVNPEFADGCLLHTELLEDTGRLEEAERELRGLVARSPTVGMASARLGLLLQKTGRAEEALTHLRRAAHAQPRNSQDYYLKAGILGGLFEQWRDALACLDAALALEPASLPALTLKGDAHTYFLELDLARQSYQEAQVLRPDDREIANKLEALDAFVKAQAFEPDRPAAALEAYRRALDLQPNNVAYLFSTAVALAAMQRPGEALPLFDKGFELTPNSVTGHIRWIKIQCLQLLYLIPEAQDVARTTLPLVSDSTVRKALEQLLNAEPPRSTREQVAAHWYAAGIQAQQANQFREAAELLRRSVYIAPSHAVYLAALAATLVMLGAATDSQRSEAEGFTLFERSLNMNRHPSVLFNYASCLHMVGRLADALAVAENLLTVTPDDPHLIAMIEAIEVKQFRPN